MAVLCFASKYMPVEACPIFMSLLVLREPEFWFLYMQNDKQVVIQSFLGSHRE